MPADALNRTPSWGDVAREQLRALALLQRRDFLVVGGIGGLIAALALWGLTQLPADDAMRGPTGPVDVFPMLTVPLVLVAALWPLGVWRHDQPSRRGYFWSLPVARGPHTLLRAGIGWTLLMAVCLAAMAVTGLLALAYSARIATFEASPAHWYVPLVSATLAYVLMSALAVTVDNPIRAVIWGVVALFGVRLVGEVGGLAWLGTLVDRFVGSFATALWGAYPLVERDPSGWATHYGVWLAVGAAALVAGAYRHRDGS